MSGNGALPPDRVPTLTEVVAWPHAPAPGEAQLPLPAVETRPAEADMVGAPMPPLRVADEEMI
ncbi:MAG: hypothetical protein ABUL50_07115, partial [Rhizobacter sp.]